MLRKIRYALPFFIVVLAVAVFGQEPPVDVPVDVPVDPPADEPPGLDAKHLLQLAFNSGLVFAIVEVVKLKIIPGLRKMPWVIPLIATGLGAISGTVLANYGLDIGPIVGAFTGLAASGAFAVVKEGTGRG